MVSISNWKKSLNQLVEGNMRFRMGLRSVEAFASSLRLKEFAENGQRPSAIILTCSDSRVPTEILFDKGVGDLFVIRIAGNVVSESVIASIEYAALALGTPLCVVMGHTQCGAVKAAVDRTIRNESVPTESISGLLQQIQPAVDATIGKNKVIISEPDLLNQTIYQNVANQAHLIQKRSAVLSNLVSKGEFQIIGAIYDLHNGEVRFEGVNPVAATELIKMNFIPSHEVKENVQIGARGEHAKN